MKKLILKFPVLAVLAGLVLVFSQSAFTTKKVLVNDFVYLHDPINNQYTLFSEDGSLPEEGGCVLIENQPDCYISYTTKQGDDFPSATPPGGGLASGTEGVWEE